MKSQKTIGILAWLNACINSTVTNSAIFSFCNNLLIKVLSFLRTFSKSSKDRIKVVCRIRPENKIEKEPEIEIKIVRNKFTIPRGIMIEEVTRKTWVIPNN